MIDLSKMRRHYPGQELTRSLDDFIAEIVVSLWERLGG